ncbi:hypothetical protein [Apilactobacillus apinorum]|uniref:Uncharacterized protein n=1 Tax=Apilactobacillus apinorum TaxID=1218495 RepID=A0ABP9ZIC4_9LACO
MKMNKLILAGMAGTLLLFTVVSYQSVINGTNVTSNAAKKTHKKAKKTVKKHAKKAVKSNVPSSYNGQKFHYDYDLKQGKRTIKYYIAPSEKKNEATIDLAASKFNDTGLIKFIKVNNKKHANITIKFSSKLDINASYSYSNFFTTWLDLGPSSSNTAFLGDAMEGLGASVGLCPNNIDNSIMGGDISITNLSPYDVASLQYLYRNTKW